MATNGMNDKKGIVEIIQLSESYTDIPSSSSSGSCEAAAPRISFSNEEAAEVAAEEDCSAGSSSEAEFEFSNTGIQAQASNTADPISMADELFYNGKLLPLEPMSRMAMVQDLSQQEEIGTMRRGRSTRTPARPHFQVGPCTRKSSSYPPPGCSSRPPPARKWKDLFGLKKLQQQGEGGGKPTSSSKTLLKMVFFNKGSSSTTSAAACNEATSPAPPKNQASSSSRVSSDARSQNTSSRPRKSQAPIKLGHSAGTGGGGGSRAAAAAIAGDAHNKLSPPPSPLRSYAKASVNVAPVLHVPAYITSLKPFRRESRSPVEVL